jgi:sec-independent protein translocase protein TatB
MFDITSSKLLILGLVALIVVGPKELPQLLRTIGKYMGIIRRQAAEFRAQFDEAMRESELDQLKKDVEGMGRDVEATVRDAEMSVEREVAAANSEFEQSMQNPQPTEPPAADTPAAVPALEPSTPPPVPGPQQAKTEA